MDAPSLETVRGASQILSAAFPADADPSTDEALEQRILLACEIVSSLTCRSIGPDAEGEEVPAGKQATATQAVIAKAEQLQIAFANAQAATAAYGSGNLQSFSAGPYSESYFGPDAMAKAKKLDPNPLVHQMLWSLATDECRWYWLSTWDPENYPAPPEAAAIAYDYGDRPGYQRWW